MGLTVAQEQHWCVEGDLDHERGLVLQYDDLYWAVGMVASGDLQVVGHGLNKEGAIVKLREFWADEQRRDLWERRVG